MNKLIPRKGSRSVALPLLPLVFGLSSCGPSENSKLTERVDIDSGVYSRHSIIERDPNMGVPSSHGQIPNLSYFPTLLPKAKYGEDIFWTFSPEVKFKIAQDPDKWFPDSKLLEATVPAPNRAFTGTYYHADMDLPYQSGSPWRVEFRPFFKVKASSDSNEFIFLNLIDHHVCARISGENMLILDERKNTINSEAVRLTSRFQDVRLSHTVDSTWYQPFRASCEQGGGFVASSLDITLNGGENLNRVIQFVELRVIREESL